MTFKKYLVDPALKGSAHITSKAIDDTGTYVCLSETCFHPQGGGQPADKGRIESSNVISVRENGDEIRHYVEPDSTLEQGQIIEFQVDSMWRNLCSKYHTGGHVIAALVAQRFIGSRPIGGHHWIGEARVEFDGLESEDILVLRDRLTEDVAEIVEHAITVYMHVDQYGERRCMIGDFPSMRCSGTHVTNTRQLDGLNITGIKTKKENVRVSYGFTA
jgi:alanyl-tRNA synthetase